MKNNKNFILVLKFINILIIIGFFILSLLFFIGDISIDINIKEPKLYSDTIDVNEIIIDFMDKNRLVCGGSKLYFDYGDLHILIKDFKVKN